MIQALERPRLQGELPHHLEASGRIQPVHLVRVVLAEATLAGGVG
jgi:hypothetical protein